MDSKVLLTQQWLNATYVTNGNFVIVDEDGITGTKTIKGLIRALQIELGVTVDGVFGDATYAAFTPLSISSDSSNVSISHQVYILQGALYCKGQNLDPIYFNGVYNSTTKSAVQLFQTYAGLASQDGIANAMIMDALLNTDAYTKLSTGDENIRTIQRALNNLYNAYFGLLPCDGIYSKKTNKALIMGLQVEEKKEYSNNLVDGIWGDTTMNRCPTLQRYGTVTNKQYVYLLQYALYVNGYNPNGFDGGFGSGVKTAAINFQTFSGLTADGIVGKRTWASLLVSYGDKTRVGTACDCMTPLTIDTAQSIVTNGRTAVGRYLTGGTNKKLTTAEMQIIYNAGLRIIPIYQTTNNYAEYFTELRGAKDAYLAYSALTKLKFPQGTIVYFAVDFDATVDDVQNYVMPYFTALAAKFNTFGNGKYTIGIYGPRYVCTLVKTAGFSFSSFVCDMSSGFSCNIGYSLPSDWAFDQISTNPIGTGGGSITVDNNIASGRNAGVLVDPSVTFNITEADDLLEHTAAVARIYSTIGLNMQFPALNFEFEKTFVLIETTKVKISLLASLVYSTDSDADFSVNVTSGIIEDADFLSALEKLNAAIKKAGIICNLPDFSALALEIGNGKMDVKIQYDPVTSIITLSIKTAIYKYDGPTTDVDISVTLEFAYNLNNNGDGTVSEETLEKVTQWFMAVDWNQIKIDREYFMRIILLMLVVIVVVWVGLDIALLAVI